MLFLLLSILVLNGIAFWIPKKLTRHEIYVTSLFAGALAIITDTYLDLKHDLYGYFHVGPDYEVLLVLFGLYPAYNVIYLNLFPYMKGLYAKAVYLLLNWLFCLFYEWLSVQPFGFFYYNGWKLWYSALVYPFLLVTLLGHLLFVRQLYSPRKQP